MRVKNKVVWALSLFAVVVMVYSILQLSATPVLANNGGSGGTCCTTSADCPDKLLCYYPSGGQTDCSPSHLNYCR